MKKKLLCCALLGMSAMAQSAVAQSFDDRWYITTGVGYNFQDSDRRTDDAWMGTLGFGKMISPNWSLDFEVNYQNPHMDFNEDLWFSQYGASVDARYHFFQDGRNWWPYIRFGLGIQKAEEEYSNFPSPDSPGQREDTNMAANLGVGLQADYDRFAVRGELGTRVSFDDSSVVSPDSDSFVDLLASVTLLWKLGDLVAPVVPVPAPQVTCADLDDDGDGVNNCDDKCPGTVAGTAVGMDGCPLPPPVEPAPEPIPYRG